MDAGHSPSLHVTPEQGRARPKDPGHPSTKLMAHGSMEVRWFHPTNGRQHLPHDRDELYFIVAGTAVFCCACEFGPFDEDRLGLLGIERAEVGPGEVVFVPAGAEHWFDDPTPDFAVWAVFYGPEGGEPP